MINLMQPDLGDAELLKISEVFKSNWLGRGSVVTDFESRFADNLNAPPENFSILFGSLQNVCEIQVMPFSCHFFRLQPYASSTLNFYTYVDGISYMRKV